MKPILKIMISVMAAAGIASCQISKYHEYNSGEIALERRADILVDDYVISPVTILRTAFAFEDYLAKTEAEKVQDTIFYGNVRVLGENSYRIMTDWIDMSVAVDESGRALGEDGSSWKIGLNYIDVYYGYRSKQEDFYEATLAKETGTDVWVLENDNFTTSIRFETDSEDMCTWTVGTQGREDYSNGVSISFATVPDMSVNEYFSVRNDRAGNMAFSGKLNYKVYKDDREMDYCHATYKAGFSADYQTSR
ncbi:MAG: hypothetical protein ACI3ZL_00360 [Candidatus Cryptobacteroides sp.]